jgi:hypothetical protein
LAAALPRSRLPPALPHRFTAAVPSSSAFSTPAKRASARSAPAIVRTVSTPPAGDVSSPMMSRASMT